MLSPCDRLQLEGFRRTDQARRHHPEPRACNWPPWATPKDRAYFEAKVIEERLTYKQLYDAIKQKFGVRRKPGAGRPMKIPRDVTKALIHLNAQADYFMHCNEQVWFGKQFDIIESLTTCLASLLNDKFKDQLTEAAETCERLAELAETDAQKLREALSEVERRMAVQAEYEQQGREEENFAVPPRAKEKTSQKPAGLLRGRRATH